MRKMTALVASLAMALAAIVVSSAGELTCEITEFLYAADSPGFPTLAEATDDGLDQAQVDEVASGNATSTSAGVTVDAGAADYFFSIQENGGYLLLFYARCSGPAAASAHPKGDWYAATWPGASPNVHWRFTQEVTGTQKRDSIRISSNTWDNAGTADFRFTNDTPDHADFGFDSRTCADGFDNTVHWETIQGSALAKARLCVSGNDIVDFMIGFDSGVNWYLGSGTPAADEYDLRWTSTHEFGHATGGWVKPGTKGHWDEGGEAQLCPENGKHTLCSYVTFGETWGRTLESHDQHTFPNAY